MSIGEMGKGGCLGVWLEVVGGESILFDFGDIALADLRRCQWQSHRPPALGTHHSYQLVKHLY